MLRLGAVLQCSCPLWYLWDGKAGMCVWLQRLHDLGFVQWIFAAPSASGPRLWGNVGWAPVMTVIACLMC